MYGAKQRELVARFRKRYDFRMKVSLAMEIELHGMEVWQAEAFLKGVLDQCTEKEVRVIHGYRNGVSLKKFVQDRFHHKKILRKEKTLNPGETILILK